MGLKELFSLLLAAATFASIAEADSKVVVCYLGTWANYRQGDGKFLIEHINPFHCTHLVYGFAKLDNNKITVYDPYLDLSNNWGLGAFNRFVGLKKVNPNLKVIIAIGGWNEGSVKYSAMAADSSARATFVQSVLDFCDQYGFDGLDMDWEYPANRGGVPEDKANFVTLLKDLKTAFEPKGLLLTAAVAAGKSTMDTAYDIPGMSKYLDLINVMAYDLHGSWEKVTGHNAPLYARDSEPESDLHLNVDYAMKYWMDHGCPKEKLVLGMGTYGRSFALGDASNTGLGAPAVGPGAAGEMTREPGMLGYHEICLKLKQGWKEVFVDGVDAPYAYSGNQWVGYDNIKSIKIKTEYAMKLNLRGIMFWSLETDDFRGSCGDGSYPLIGTASKMLLGDRERSTLSPDDVNEIGQRTTAYPGELFRCPKEGRFRNPSDCSVYYLCQEQGNGEYSRHEYNCGNGLAFDKYREVCDTRENAGC